MIVVAIRAAVAAGLGTEEVDAVGSVGVPQPTSQFVELAVAIDGIDAHGRILALLLPSQWTAQ